MGFLSDTGCGALAAAITKDCDNPLIGGVEPNVLVMVKSEIETITIGVDGISNIAMSSTKKAYKFELERNAVNAGYNTREATYRNTYEHFVNLVIAVNDHDSKQTIEAMDKLDLCFIVRNKNGDYEFYGMSQGLISTTGARDASSTDNNGAHTREFKTGVNGETKLPITINAGSESATETLISGLVIAAA